MTISVRPDPERSRTMNEPGFENGTTARITVQRGPLMEYPLAERVRDGWQNGVTFYPDTEVVKVVPVLVRPLHTDERVRYALMDALSATYTCARVWEAWSYGTMTDEDFAPAWEDEELLDSIVAAVKGASNE